MKKIYTNKILLVLFIVLIFWYFFPEITLLSKNLFINKRNVSFFPENLVTTTKLTYEGEINIDESKYDLEKSYVLLSGSKCAFLDQPGHFISLLEKTEVFSKIYLNEDKDLENINKIILKDDQILNRHFNIIAELILFDKNGARSFDYQIYSVSENTLTYLVNRGTYLFQFMIWFFAIFGMFIKTAQWATVYDSKTKSPISGAIVRIYSDNNLVDTIVTTSLGIINVKLRKGKYNIVVVRPDYEFPSKLRPLSEDGLYKKLYYGEEFSIEKDSSRILYNIPLDPKGEVIKRSVDDIVSSFAVQTFGNFNSWFLAFVIIAQIILWPTYIDTWIFGLIGLILFAVRYIRNRRSRARPGKVVDTEGRPVANIRLDLFDTEWNKKVGDTLSNAKGEYELLLFPGRYYIKLESPEWKIVGADKDQIYLVKGKIYDKVLHVNEKIVVKKIN